MRGELVALLDKVESHYGQVEPEPAAPAMTGLAQRVRHLRDQVGVPEPTNRRREALRTVKRAVDRFSERDAHLSDIDDANDLTSAIAEIRSRQGAAPMPMRRANDMPEIRELGSLVGGMSQRLERLEGELKSQRSSAGHVREVASQVEQLTQVVELLAGAVGETGQVKRLEAQIAAIGAMIEEAPRNDLSTLNARLDDVSATVGKLAELQAQQMEREIARDQRRNAESKSDAATTPMPAMQGIEDSVRNVYDRIDAIERSVAMSSGDFERLTNAMASFTQTIQDGGGAPGVLADQIEALVSRLDDAGGNADVAALKAEMASLRNAVLQGMEPRFSKIEDQIEALGARIVPVDTKAVESQLKLLMDRMDDAGAQLDGLARLYNADERPDLESLANMAAERASEAVSRKAAAPVAVFGPESLKSIEDRLTGLIKSAGKTPDYEQLADLVAARTSEAMRAPAGGGLSEEGMDALEKRMTALFNTAGKDTAERLTRLEAVLAGKSDPAPAAKAEARTAPMAKPAAAAPVDQFAQALAAEEPQSDKLDAIMASLIKDQRDTMPANPGIEAPLVDKGFGDKGPVRSALAGKINAAEAPAPRTEKPMATPDIAAFDLTQAERPPRPRSSFAEPDNDPFAPAVRPQTEGPVETVASSSTSTFVAAARRAQRAKQDEAQTSDGGSLMAKALARVRSRKEPSPTEPAPVAPARAVRQKDKPAKEAIAAPVAASVAPPLPEPDAAAPSFLARNRRPLLLAATLIAVSMLALNLVMQRTGSNAPNVESAPAVTENPAPSDDQSAVVPPRVIDMVDVTATGSINPGEPMSFARSSALASSTPLPPTLKAEGGRIAIATADPVAAPEVTGSIGAPTPGTDSLPETYDLPPEAIGPIELREAAAGGSAQAQFEVAAIFGEGRALAKDLEQSARWYERSAAQGFVPAQYRLGNLYEMGSGVDKNLEQARLWYQRSAEAGNRMAMHNLAALYAGGEMGEQQFELAAEWFAKAAEHGMTDSQFNLGMLYARGLGVEQDFEQSFKWFSLAARSGDQDAAKARDDIAKSLSAEAVDRVGDAIATWKLQPFDLAANFAPIGTWSSNFDAGEAITNTEVIAKVQQALGKLGFDIGTPDGVAGPKTRDAIRAFEKATGMSEIGAINPRLLAVLGSQPV
ncbi:peptidoglycan-binding protein [Devosia sp. XJ19-1]|uniref:Peptidoglycan-binding protein n=1 Tax=Devosia ureilytica TaxID=2952754 RepID=A0A9Q4FSM4_9HYPH|nr:peptidoglycan-binding protein [Devosia ureilytica]MCP8885283.1 peptidoglycan-binding protein [Devosia ureilytica]MCP8888741.1 peptidoglycan-binding protein [Devosia ureilytica]